MIAHNFDFEIMGGHRPRLQYEAVSLL